MRSIVRSNQRTQYLRSVSWNYGQPNACDTIYLYPTADINAALAITTHPYTFDGVNIVCPDIPSLYGVYNDIFAQTYNSQPVGNRGYSCGVGTIFQDLGKQIFFKLPGDNAVVHWRLVKQITPQTNPPLSSPANSPNGTVGYLTVWNSFAGGAAAAGFECPNVVRFG
jgi:hypothetical protein